MWATTYDQEQNPLILTEEPRVRALLDNLPRPFHALDVATGTGRWAFYLAQLGASVVGIDESPEMLAVGQQKARAANLAITFIQGSIEDGLPFSSDGFDLVVCALALCHMTDLEAAVGECSRVLRPGGYLLITDFHPEAVLNGWETTIAGPDETYVLPNARHSLPAYLEAVRQSGCDVIHREEVLVREQPQEAILRGEDIDVVRREYGDWPFCLILLAR